MASNADTREATEDVDDRRRGGTGGAGAVDASLGRRAGTGGAAAAGAGDLTPETLFRSASRRLNGLSLIDGGELAMDFRLSFLHQLFAQQTRPATIGKYRPV